MSGSGKDVWPPAPAPSGPGRGRPKKVRPRENEASSGTGIGAEVKRRRKSFTGGGESGELGPRTTGSSEDNETTGADLKDPDPPVTRSGARSEKHLLNKRKQNAVKVSGSDGEIGSAHEHGREGESQDEEKDTALDVVLNVHGVCPHATECAAAFPGETGQETGGYVHLCACCMKPEVSKLTLLCDGCERSFHVSCLKLALHFAAEIDDWICTSCSAAYPGSELATGFSKAVREDIERNLFSQERKTYDDDEGVQNEVEEKVSNAQDDDQSMVVVTAASQEPQDLNQTDGSKVTDGDQHRQDSTSTIHSVFPERRLLDLNEVTDKCAEGSLRRNLGIDLNESRSPEFEDEVFKVDESSKPPEAERGVVNDLVLLDDREPFINATEACLERSASETKEELETLPPLAAEESSGVRNVLFPAVAGSFTVVGLQTPCVVGESCVEEIKSHGLAEATSEFKSKPPGTPEACIITDASRPTLFSTEFTVQNEKLTFTSASEIPTTVADCTLPLTSEESNRHEKSTSTDPSGEIIGGNEEEVAGYPVGGELTPVVEIQLLENPEPCEIMNTSRSVKPLPELTAATEINQARTKVVATDAENMAVESGCLISADSQKSAYVDARVMGMPQEAVDVGKGITCDLAKQDGKGSTTKQSEKQEKRGAKNGSKLVERLQGAVVPRPGIPAECVEIYEPEPTSCNTLPTFPVLLTSPMNSPDVIGVQPECQQSKKAANKIAGPASNPDRAKGMNVGLNGSRTGKPTEETSPLVPDDNQLRTVRAESLQQLREFIREKHGLTLADGWEVEVRRRRNERHLDKYYISPEKHRFRSRVEVMKHLGLRDGLKSSSQDGSKGKCEAQQPQPKEWMTMARRVAGGNTELQLPLKLGDLTLESLGVIDWRPGYWDEQHIWPVGYRCTWHDPATSSYCVSEVADGGISAPVFRVTRKYCHTIFGPGDCKGDAVDLKCDTSDLAVKDLRSVREDIMTASVDRMPSWSHGVKSQYGNGFDVEEEESLKALLGEIGSFPSGIHNENEKLYRDGRNLDEISKIGIQVMSEDCNGSQPRDLIGEFSVEAVSTAEVWRLYAEKFGERYRKMSFVSGSILKPCPHKTTAFMGASPTEVPNPKDLVEKLREDRFGLNQSLVIGLIETLPYLEKCFGYKSLKQRGLLWKEADSDEIAVQPSRSRVREKAKKQKKTLEVNAEERAVAAQPVEVNGNDDVDAPLLVGERPRPRGQSLELRLPSEYVGNVLQILECLRRFSSLIGFSQPPVLEDLEEGLTCGSASVSECMDQSDSLHKRRSIGAFNTKPKADGRCDVALDVEVPHTARRSTTSEVTGSPQNPKKNHSPGRAYLASSVPVPRETDAGRMEHLREDDGKAVGSPSNDTTCLMEPNYDKGEPLLADLYTKSSGAKLINESGLASAASVHVPLIKFLIADLQSKVCGIEELPGDSDDSKHKRGRKRMRDIVASASLGTEKSIGSFSINELTWPEVARRYIIALSRITKIGERAEYRIEECFKILRCIQGDGGVLCGALNGVAGMELDAQLLGEAEKEISALMLGNEETAGPSTPPQNCSSRDPVVDGCGEDSSGECARWVKLLDPIAKLPTNVGSRIRNRVLDALAANPPAWAATLLEHSITKKVYKGNASGPTKRIVMDVLQKYRGEDPDPKVKKAKKQRKRVLPSPEVVMQRCRIVLRQVATADTSRVVAKSYSCMTNFYESEGGGLLPRPLDFRAIDLRLGAGAYGTSPDSFAADVKQIWKNVASLNENGNVEAAAVIQLSELFDNLYNKQVILFQRGGDQAAVTGSEGPDRKIDGKSNEESQKNITEEKPLGSDANKPVKAPSEDDSCRVCGIDDDHDNVLLCDGCDAEYHIYCLNPPLPKVPDGNWFCHSCVAVDSGFLEAANIRESATEAKALDMEDEHHQMRGHYPEQMVEKDQLRKSDELIHSSLRAIVLKLGETDYWHLTLAQRVDLLKWLCDQALGTPKLRSHVEKSMDGVPDLQQKLRTLLAERRMNADSDEARPDDNKEGSREVNILSVLQSRGAISKKPDEFDEETSVLVDIVDGMSVSGPSTDTAGTSNVLQSDSTRFVGTEEHAPVGTVVDTLRYSFLSAKHARTEHEEKDIVAHHSRGNPVLDPMEVDLPNSAVRRSCGLPKDGCGGGTGILNREGNFGSDDLNATDTADVLFADSRNNTESSVRANRQVVQPRNLFTAFDEGLESRRKCPKDEPFCPEVDVEDNISQGNSNSFSDAEIEKIKTKLMLLNCRRDLLGRDDIGRIYWALCSSKTSPWLAVEIADDQNSCQTENQEGLAARAELERPSNSSALFPFGEKLQMEHVSTTRDPSTRLVEFTDGSPTGVSKKESKGACSSRVRMQPQEELAWFIYSNESVLEQLIECLSPASSQERLLKATLLQWKSILLLFKDGGPEEPGGLREFFAGSPRRGYGLKTTNTQGLACQDVRKSRRCVMPELKASSLLDWKYGQLSDPVKVPSTSGGSKRGRKRKTQETSKIARCDCLEPLWASRCHCRLCHTTYESEVEFQAHTTGGTCSSAGEKAFGYYEGVRSGKKSCHDSNAVIKSLKSACSQQSLTGILAPPDVAKMPMVLHESLLDRINRIGCIADKGPLFAPGLAISPAFDPALMIVDLSMIRLSGKAGGLSTAIGILGTVAVGATSCINHEECENSVNGYRILISSSENLPGQPITEAEGAEALNAADHVSLSPLPMSRCPVVEHAGPPFLDVQGLTNKEETQFSQDQSADFARTLGGTFLGAYDLPYELNDHPSQSQYKGYYRNLEVTGKQLTIPDASLGPLEGEADLDILRKVKGKLLDIEAAVTPDMSENARAYPRRRQAWRSMLKFAKSIYTVVQAIILLEQMISADFLRTSWCFWSSFTVAAKTSSLSSVYLRVCALDAAIMYEKSENYAGADLTNCESTHGRQKKEKEEKKNCQPLKPPRKKKKKEVIADP